MALDDDLRKEVQRIFRDRWTVRDGQVVPDPENVGLSNDAVKFDRATVLYADLAGSTSMVQNYSWQFAAEVYRSFLLCGAKLVRGEGGVITAYDGDRIMGVFLGDLQSTNAVRCSFKINSAIKNIVVPALTAQYSNVKFALKHVVGIDTSPINVARTGVRGGNDLVWVGRAANYAAKLTELDLGPTTWITKAVFDKIGNELKYRQDGTLMWKKWSWNQMDNIEIHSSEWWW